MGLGLSLGLGLGFVAFGLFTWIWIDGGENMDGWGGDMEWRVKEVEGRGGVWNGMDNI